MNTPVANPIVVLLQFALVIWIMGYGFSLILGGAFPQVQKWYLGLTKRMFKGALTHLIHRPLQHLWKQHKKFLIGLLVGAAIVIWMYATFNPSPTP